MKSTKIGLVAALIAAVLLAYHPAVLAQSDTKDSKASPTREGRGRPGGGGPEAMKQRLNRMAEELKLSDEQKTKVEAAFKSELEKRNSIRQDSSLSQDQKREKGRALREEMSKKMKEILSAEQYEKWEKMRPARGQDRPGGEKKGKGRKAQ